MKVSIEFANAPGGAVLPAIDRVPHVLRAHLDSPRRHDATYRNPILWGAGDALPTWATYETPNGTIVLRELAQGVDNG